VILFGILYWVVLAFLLLLIGRLVIDWIQVFAREWRPKGPILVVAEIIYTVTDPPLKLLRRLIPPLRLGSVQLDLAFFILFLLTYVLLNVLQQL
jgi:YggT family protein